MARKNDQIEKQTAAYETMRQKMQGQGYTEKIVTISVVKANVLALVTSFPILFVCWWVYFLFWNETSVTFDMTAILLFLILWIISLPVHELIHGITWSLFCKSGRKSIHLGVIWRALTPYCHCSEPLSFGGYILGGLMPFFVLGIGLFIASLVSGNLFLLALSLISTLGAGGDLAIACKILKYHNGLIYDHPTECGFILFSK